MTAEYQKHGAIAVITLSNPPVNGLSLPTRKAIAAGLTQAMADPTVQAIVLTGTESAFSAGADFGEFGTPHMTAAPDLPDLINAIELTSKPVIAALRGDSLGGGLELALGCHYRIAQTGSRIALPESKLGLIPGAGGTQRLPRLLGLEAALNLMVSGEVVKAEVLAEVPGQRLLNRIVQSELLPAALAYASEVATLRPLPRARNLKVEHPNAEAYLQFTRTAVKGVTKTVQAALKCIDAVQASVNRPFEEGLVIERELFMGLLAQPESKALRHGFLAERAASKIPDVPKQTPVRPIRKVAVIGAGTMGAGIAMNFLDIGLPVAILENNQQALDRGVAGVRKTYEAQVKKRRISADQLEQRLALLTPTLSYEAIGDNDLVIEAVFEDQAVKQAVFERLDAVMKDGAILASNTSTLDLNRIAAFTRRPQDVIGAHFFSPAHVMKLLEVVRGAATAKDVLATMMAVGKQIKKTCVVSGVCDGFIGNRMIEQYLRQAYFLLDEGCTPAQVDRAIEKFGFAMGPYRMGDLAGNDVGAYIRKRRYAERPDIRYSKVADRLCDLGRHGQKVGAGWYDYPEGQREGVRSAVVEDMVQAYRQEQGITARKIDDAEIVQRLVFALVNEGARIVEEGIALRASDVDLVYLTGYGFPRHRGGPMCYADTFGLWNVVQAMGRFAANPLDDADFWQPAPLLLRHVAEGTTFN
jgi:3-hydroxyacyl-CoA dehydrogenase